MADLPFTEEDPVRARVAEAVHRARIHGGRNECCPEGPFDRDYEITDAALSVLAEEGRLLPAGARREEIGVRVDVAHPMDVLAEVADERTRQDQRWGEQNHPDGTGPDWRILGASAQRWLAVVRSELDRSTKPRFTYDVGDLVTLPPTGPTWLLIALEEVFEALVETDPGKLRAELIQIAAVAVAWAEAIDRRGAGKGEGE